LQVIWTSTTKFLFPLVRKEDIGLMVRIEYFDLNYTKRAENYRLLHPFQIGYAAPAIAAAPALSYHPAPVAKVAYAAPAVAKVRF
jgi:hypothetical protein